MYTVEQLPSNIWGLKYLPSIEDNKADVFQEFYDLKIEPPHSFSLRNQEKLREILTVVQPQTILEIGVANYDNSSTSTIFQSDFNGRYFGVDLQFKVIDDVRSNLIYCNSFERENINNWLKTNNVETIDLIHIDGWHSVEAVINDWQFTEWLSPRGVVVLHDISIHPGPHLIMDAIDTDIFRVERWFTDCPDDWGLGVAWRIDDSQAH